MFHPCGLMESPCYTDKLFLPLGSIRLGIGMAFGQDGSGRIIQDNSFCLSNCFVIVSKRNIHLDGFVGKLSINNKATSSMSFLYITNEMLNPKTAAHKNRGNNSNNKSDVLLVHRAIR